MTPIRVETWAALALLGLALGAPACAATSATSSGEGGHRAAHTTGTGVAHAATSGGGQGTTGGLTGGVGAGGAGTSTSTGTGAGTGGKAPGHCDPAQPDLDGCACPASGTTRACYPLSANPKTRDVGACKDGHQTCQGGAEFATWGPCTGAVTPSAENCAGTTDNDCNGLSGCKDPSCAGAPVCNMGCINGEKRPCYDGPPGTENTGTCVPGIQTCTNGTWTAGCPGEVLPGPEVCNDLLDHNCNGIPGCFDLLACFGDPACQPPPCMPANGCTCPTGTGDAATCPNGDYGDPLTGLCCACSASTCDQLGCCGEPICAGSAVCAPLTCGDLPAACNGLVNVDCDYEDLASADAQNPPEDCDQACCKCKPLLCP